MSLWNESNNDINNNNDNNNNDNNNNNNVFSFCMDIFSKNNRKRENVTPIKRARASS